MFTSRQRSGAKTKVVFMVMPEIFRQPGDIAQVLLSVLFFGSHHDCEACCLWMVQPFILGFAWAGTIVIATRGPFLKNIVGPPLASCRTGHDAAVSAALRYSVALLVNSIVDGSGPLHPYGDRRRYMTLPIWHG